MSKLVGEVRAERVIAAVLLTYNYTDTKWRHEAAGASDAIYFTRERIRFYGPNGERAQPVRGQCFQYFGPDAVRFADVFREVGRVLYTGRKPALRLIRTELAAA